MHNNFCKVCGLTFKDFYPWGPNGDLTSFEICPCCGVEWGYEDCSEEATVQYRLAWICDGMKWFMPEERPVNWNVYQQLEKVLSSGELINLEEFIIASE